MILIFYALRREVSGLRKRISRRVPLGSGMRGFRGRIGTEEIFLVATGIGIAQAREPARRALRLLPLPRIVISTGVAGALAPDLRAGDLVIADRLLMEGNHDSSFDEIARMTPDAVQSVRDTLRRAGLTCSTGAVLTARRVLASADAKRSAYTRSGALAVDMESAVIAAEFAPSAVPFVCIRAVIDEADEDLPGAELPDETGHVAPLKAALYFLKNPSALALVPTMLRNLSRATASISSALEALCLDTSGSDARPTGLG
jgi:adenosylhomocysteine nucleosidase